MKGHFKRVFSFVIALVMIASCIPCTASASEVSFNRIVNAATDIIIQNEGNYSTVVKNDNGALSIGIICWHATNALNLLKSIIALNPSQALNILGASLYNEIITCSYWETRIATSEEAAVISVLISTNEGQQVQNESAAQYISGYVLHGQKLGITEPEALVFFADYENQNGYTGAQNFIYNVKSHYSELNLSALYNTSNKNSRRTKTYNFCASINWNSYSDTLAAVVTDTQAPEISCVTLTELDENGYTVTCNVSDNTAVVSVYFAIYYKKDGTDGIKWYQQEPVDGTASHTVSVNEFSGRAGDYCTYIYAFDESGNYSFVELNTITVPSAAIDEDITLTVSSTSSIQKGDTLKWSASAANGSGSYQYYYEIYKDDELIGRRKYSDYSDYEYTPTESGIYRAKVTLYDTVQNEYVTVESTDVNIFDPIILDSFSTQSSAAIINQLVSYELSVSGGEGDMKYSYTLYRNGTAIRSTDYSSTTTYSFKPTQGGVYYLVVNVTDSRSQTASFTSDSISVVAPLSVDSLSFSDSYAISGKTVNVTAEVNGGTGEYTYIFTVYCDGEKIITSEELTLPDYTFTISQSGTYTAEVTVIDADSTTIKAQCSGLTAEAQAKRGDANCDGVITAADARYTLRCSVMLETPESDFEYALDVNNDGKITAADARTILRISAYLEG